MDNLPRTLELWSQREDHAGRQTRPGGTFSTLIPRDASVEHCLFLAEESAQRGREIPRNRRLSAWPDMVEGNIPGSQAYVCISKRRPDVRPYHNGRMADAS
jgi:hypothetical protein